MSREAAARGCALPVRDARGPRRSAGRKRGIKSTLLFLCAGAFTAAILGGCASQRVESREWYETTPETMQTRKDGERTGAIKSETIKSGQPDWSGYFHYATP